VKVRQKWLFLVHFCPGKNRKYGKFTLVKTVSFLLPFMSKDNRKVYILVPLTNCITSFSQDGILRNFFLGFMLINNCIGTANGLFLKPHNSLKKLIHYTEYRNYYIKKRKNTQLILAQPASDKSY
jgi:hypothetical protein